MPLGGDFGDGAAAGDRDDDLDERFASIVAHWDDAAAPTDATAGPEPDPPATDPPTGSAGSLAASAATRFVPFEPQAWRGHSPDEIDEHFEPPPPDPLPAPEDDPFFWAIVVGLVGGPLLVLWVVLFRQGGSTGWLYAGIAATVVGFVLLVLRKGNSRDDDDFGIRL